MDGLLKAIAATVLKTALEEELTEHLGHEKHQAPTAGSGNIRSGTRPQAVLIDAAGEVIGLSSMPAVLLAVRVAPRDM